MFPEYDPYPIDIDAVTHVVASYVDMRTAMVSRLRENPTTHMQFIQFCNDQSGLLNQALGTLDEGQLQIVLRYARRGVFPLDTPELDAAFIELLICQIAYQVIERTQKAAQN